jgi:hypothetical protein
MHCEIIIFFLSELHESTGGRHGVGFRRGPLEGPDLRHLHGGHHGEAEVRGQVRHHAELQPLLLSLLSQDLEAGQAVRAQDHSVKIGSFEALLNKQL